MDHITQEKRKERKKEGERERITQPSVNPSGEQKGRKYCRFSDGCFGFSDKEIRIRSFVI
jgi:hypothetical protein